MKKIYIHIEEYLKENIKRYFFISIFIIIGILVGSLIGIKSYSLSPNTNILDEFFSLYKIAGIVEKEIFIKSFISNIRLLFFLWISGMSPYLLPLNLSCNIIKGFAIGYTFSFLVCESGLSGFIFSFISIFFQNFITIPFFVLFSVYQMNLGFNLRQARKNMTGYKQLRILRNKNNIVLLSGILVCIVSSVVETGVVPSLIRLFYGNIA